MAPLYKPPTRVTTKPTPFLALVTEADPNWANSKYWEIEYVTSRRVFYGNPYQRGAYNRRSNVYAVGQAYGDLDQLIMDNLAPTEGNPVPGLYELIYNPLTGLYHTEDDQGRYLTEDSAGVYGQEGS